jgi:hypothetical protein
MQTYSAICKCIPKPEIVESRINIGFRRILAQRVDVKLMRDAGRVVPILTNAVFVFMATKAYRATLLKPPCLLAVRGFRVLFICE